jgi:hypothetical protein
LVFGPEGEKKMPYPREMTMLGLPRSLHAQLAVPGPPPLPTFGPIGNTVNTAMQSNLPVLIIRSGYYQNGMSMGNPGTPSAPAASVIIGMMDLWHEVRQWGYHGAPGFAVWDTSGHGIGQGLMVASFADLVDVFNKIAAVQAALIAQSL